jgi:histidinol dehydrogenase
MAFGTGTIPAVDKIFGPGNAYVVEAKRQVFGTVGIDLLPGPSEVMVIADERARPDWVAADLLAQAEHGSGRERVCLVTLSDAMRKRVLAEVSRQLGLLPRAAATGSVIESNLVALTVPDLDTAAEAANAMAPEHLELEVQERHHPKLLRKITRAGAIMLGGWSPTAVADFVAGPSHTLPTATAARFSSGLRIQDFLRRSSVVRYTKASLAKALPAVRTFGDLEQLQGHVRSLEIRFEAPPRRRS